MGQLKRATCAAAVAVATSLVVTPALGSGISAADGPTSNLAERATIAPLTGLQRICDHGLVTNVPSSGHGSGAVLISTAGATVTAEVQLTIAEPGTRYFVRLIEVPRTTLRCSAGNPGVAVGIIDTDVAGNGTVTVQEPVLPGATGAWVFIDGPPGDFYSTDLVVPI